MRLVALAAVLSKAVVLLLLIYCLLSLLLFVGDLCLVLVLVFLFDSLLPSQQLWLCRDGQFTLPYFLTKLLTSTSCTYFRL